MDFKHVIFIVHCVAKKNRITYRQALAHVVYRISLEASGKEIEGLHEILFLIDDIFKSIAGGKSLPVLLMTFGPKLKSIDTTLLKQWETVVKRALDKIEKANHEIKIRELHESPIQ